MAGEHQSVSVDSAKQEAAVTEVVKGFGAMTESAEGASALGAAQKSMFWGHETSPRSVQDSSAEMFSAVSELLKNEATLISTLETEINAALSSFTGTGHENKAQMEKINQALDRVAKSDVAVTLKASIGQFSKVFGVSTASSVAGALVGSLDGKLLMSGGLPHASSGGSSGGATSQAPTRNTRPTVRSVFLIVEGTLYMVSSPMYERLKVFMEAARSNHDLDTWDTDHKKTLKGFEEAAERLKRYSDNQGFQGQTADAMNQWVAESLHRINMIQSIYEAGHTTYEAGRSTVATTLKETEMISPTLLDSAIETIHDNPVVMVPSPSPGGDVSVLGKRSTIGAAYVDVVEVQTNAQREATTQRALSMVDERTSHIAALMRQQAQLSEQVKQHTDHPGTVGGEVVKGISQWSYLEGQGFGRATNRSPGSANHPDDFAQPWWSEVDAAATQNRIVASGVIPIQEPAYGELGLRTNPITGPQELIGMDLLHTPANGTVYRNGVVGGHTPAPPADAHHPLWRLSGDVASDSATAGRLGGAGVLDAGALGLRGAARMGSGNLGGSGSLGGSSVFGCFGGSGAGANGLGGSGSTGGMSDAGRMDTTGMRGVTGSTSGLGGAGAADLKVDSYSGSGPSSYTPPANSAGAGGVNGTAGSSGVTGTMGANGSGAVGAAGAAGKGGATSGSFMGAGVGTGAGTGKDNKKGRKNRYVAFKLDDDEGELPIGYVNLLPQTSGTDKDITPAKRNDNGWDPRQW